MRVAIVITALLASLWMAGQSDQWQGDTGKILLHMPVEVGALLQRHKSYIKKVEGIPGYRIQVAATSTLRDIKEVRKSFDEAFGEYQTFTIFANPAYRLQVGNYRHRIDANKDLMTIRKEFPQAFITRCPIDVMAP